MGKCISYGSISENFINYNIIRMTLEGSYKLASPYEKRCEDSKRIRDKYPDRIPVICEIGKSSNLMLDKNKYLVPCNITVGQFQYIIRKKVPNIGAEHALYMFINNGLMPVAKEMYEVYNEKKDKDGFLYTVINTESTFGNN